jgi:hypothetical protein
MNFYRWLKRFQEQNRGKNKYFFSENFDISSLIKGSGISFVDFKNRKSFFNSKILLRFWKYTKVSIHLYVLMKLLRHLGR